MTGALLGDLLAERAAAHRLALATAPEIPDAEEDG